MNPDDIPTSVTDKIYRAPFASTLSQNQVAILIAHFWPEIEAHIREQVAIDLEERIRTWPGMGQLAYDKNDLFARAARIARGLT